MRVKVKGVRIKVGKAGRMLVQGFVGRGKSLDFILMKSEIIEFFLQYAHR